MKITAPFNYQRLSRVTNADGSRFYTCPVSGKPVASVTTILDATCEKPELAAWRLRVGDKKADQIRDEATGLGLLMHDHLECYIREQTRPGGTNLVRQMASRMADTVIAKGLSAIDEVWGVETPVYYPYLYAGTSDLIAVHRGTPAIIDFKTSKTMKSASQITDYLAQVSAYSLAHNVVYGTTIRKGVIMMITRDLDFHEFVVSGDEFDRHSLEWSQRVDRYLE